jgi:hypothetical protein
VRLARAGRKEHGTRKEEIGAVGSVEENNGEIFCSRTERWLKSEQREQARAAGIRTSTAQQKKSKLADKIREIRRWERLG